SRVLGTAVIFTWLRLDPAMRAAWPRRWFAPLSGDRLRRMLHVGLPVSGSLLFEGGAFGAATIMMGWLGAAPLAAHQIALSCAAFTFMFSLGLSMAVGIRMSAAVGSGHHSRLRPIWLGGVAMGAALAAAGALVFLLWGRAIAHCFISDPAVIGTAALLLVVAAVFQVFDGGQVINAAALRGLTDVRVPAVITFVAYWLIALPLGFVLGARGLGRHQVVVRQVHERADQRGAHAEARALGKAQAVVEGLQRAAQGERDHPAGRSRRPRDPQVVRARGGIECPVGGP